MVTATLKQRIKEFFAIIIAVLFSIIIMVMTVLCLRAIHSDYERYQGCQDNPKTIVNECADLDPTQIQRIS